MTTFYICRHGETENNKSKRFSGWIDTPLTQEGVRNAHSSADKLKGLHIDKIVSSDLGRAFTTAYIISRQIGYAAEIERTAALREVNYGDYANLSYDVYPEMTPTENADFIVPNGESLRQMQQRVIEAIKNLSTANPNHTILIAAHDGTINAIRAYFTREDIGEADLTRNPHDSVSKFVCGNYGNIVSFESVEKVAEKINI